MHTTKLNVKSEIPISLGHLAHLLGRCVFPETVFELLAGNPEQAETVIRQHAEAFIKRARTAVTLESVTFTRYDSKDIAHGIAYFSAILSGNPKELIRTLNRRELFGTGTIIAKE